MASLLQTLIFSEPTGTDGLKQNEREAIVDALHYCMYADRRIALAESKVITDWQETLSWDPKLSFSGYEPRSIASARDALASPENRKAFVAGIVGRIKSAKSGETLLRLCRKLADADGARCDNEWDFIEELRQALLPGKK
jgi:uncharacterized tellurite resistance protein B-like protein